MRIQRPKGSLKKLKQLARNPKKDIWFEDECHFQQHRTRCRMWIPQKEKEPIALHAPTKKSISLFGAVQSGTGKLVSMVTRVFNAGTFLEFLEMILESKKWGKKIILIFDNARYHLAILLQSWLARDEKKIMLVFLPPYSPDFNIIERLWKMTRRLCTHNRYFGTLDELSGIVKKQMKEWAEQN
jgi:transposase